jgi:hypothetical protein
MPSIEPTDGPPPHKRWLLLLDELAKGSHPGGIVQIEASRFAVRRLKRTAATNGYIVDILRRDGNIEVHYIGQRKRT